MGVNKYYVLCVLFALAMPAITQEPLYHEKKIYFSPEGKMYINKDLPVYLWLSTEPGKDAEKHRLTSETSARYTNPMYFDAEGVNTVRSPSAVDTVTRKIVYPLQDIIFEVYADSRPPVTRISFTDTKFKSINNVQYASGMITIMFSASDSHSGVEGTYYSIDGNPYQRFEDTLELTEDKEYILKFYSVDNVGNVENPHETRFVIDNTSPVTSLEIEGDKYDNILSQRSKLILAANDNIGVDKILYQFNDGSAKTYKGEISLKDLSQGEHTISFYAVDVLNNKEPVNQYSFYLDNTPPVIIEEFVGRSVFVDGKEYSSGRSKLQLITFDNKAGVKEVFYSINNGDYEKYEEPFYLNASGNLIINTYAIDNVNNKSSSVHEGNVRVDIPYIDLTGPDINYSFDGPLFNNDNIYYINKNTSINLSAIDQESGLKDIEYKINNNEYTTYKNPFRIEKPGSHEVEIVAIDNVNNTSSISLNIIVDNSGPEIFYTYSINPKNTKNVNGEKYDVYPGHLVVFLAANDEVSGFDKMYYRLNKEPEKLYTGLITDFNSGKDYRLQVRAVDKLGNQTEHELFFAIGD